MPARGPPGGRDARAPAPASPLHAGGSKQVDAPPHSRGAATACGPARCLGLLLLVAALLAGEAAVFVFAWPRSPTLVKTELAVSSVALTTESTSALGGGVLPALAAEGAVLATMLNPMFYALMVTGAEVTLFHPGGLGRMTVSVAQVSLPQTHLPGQGRASVLRFPLLLNSSDTPGYLHACAAALAARMPCVLLVRLRVAAAAGPIALGSMQSEWTATLDGGSIAANDLFLRSSGR